MKYVSIDIETTGLDPALNNILSIAAIVEDTEAVLPRKEAPQIHIAIVHNALYGSYEAIDMNRDLISKISNWKNSGDEEKANYEKTLNMVFSKPDDVAVHLWRFLYRNGFVDSIISITEHSETIDGVRYPLINSKTLTAKFSAAGKNFATFDKVFLENLPRWKQLMRVRQRVIDPAILYVDWKNDKALPSLGECKERAGLGSHVAHDALDDAWDTIEVLRKMY